MFHLKSHPFVVSFIDVDHLRVRIGPNINFGSKTVIKTLRIWIFKTVILDVFNIGFFIIKFFYQFYLSNVFIGFLLPKIITDL